MKLFFKTVVVNTQNIPILA